MGSVFAGHDTALDRPVAVKLLPPAKRNDKRLSRRLLREARALARVAHPGMVQVFDRGFDAELGPYVVMERLDGEDLARFLHARGRLDLGTALGIMEQVCATIQAAHDAGVVHRDLKPSNLFVVRGDSSAAPRIKVLDFGAAKLDDSSLLTEPGDVLGTLAYLPPERWNTNHRVDARSDVYALGAILFEMLAGRRPFRATTRAALHLSILYDGPEDLRALRPELPHEIAGAVACALDKLPERRFNTARALAEAIGVARPGQGSPSSGAREPFRGTRRYRVVRALASGPETEVYAAWDAEQGRPVALKRRCGPHGEGLVRLKREFRALADLRHRNIVRVFEVVEEEGSPVLVMELVEGSPLLEYVAGSHERLVECLPQLVQALRALHGRGLVHGDVKSQNILVEPNGRLVLLDCGLTMRVGARAAPQGTMGFMAPEVFDGRVGAEADFYALGVVLHQALTGDLPPVPEPGRAEPPALAKLRDHDTPALKSLCQSLLHPDPGSRAQAYDVLVALGRAESAAALRAATRDPLGHLIGRNAAMLALWDAVACAAEGTPSVVWIEGTSGIGKTALLEHFRRRLEDEGSALVFFSRARQSSSIPFPALDELVDELSSWLCSAPPAVAESLLSKRSGRLARLFPALLRVPAIACAAHGQNAPQEPAQLRLQAADAFRDLFRRLCNRQPVVVLVDDVQWLDPDSADLLAALVRAPDPAPLLLVGAVRNDTAEALPTLHMLESKLPEPVQRLELGPLSELDSCALVKARWRGQKTLDDSGALRLAQQSGGNPFLADMLASGLAALPAESDDGLVEVLRASYRGLPLPSREALELTCLSTRPVRPEVLLAALGVDERALDPLVAGRFIRPVRTGAGSAFEPYHARIGESVRCALDPAARRARHQKLAQVLRADPRTDPEVLVEHLAGCGEAREAAQVALAAAQAATEQLAFDRAAALFSIALAHGGFDDEEQLSIHRCLARALQNAGRRKEAGEVLLRAVRYVSAPEVAPALRREAGSHLLLSGDIKTGLEVLAPALEGAGLRLPDSPVETVMAAVSALTDLEARGIAAPLHDRPASRKELERIDLCLLLAQGLAHIDLRALPFAILALHAALAAGHADRLQRACAVFVAGTVGHFPNPLVTPALEQCRRLTAEVSTPYSRALLHTAESETAMFQGNFLAAEAHSERAERTLLDSCAGSTRELAVVRNMSVFIQYAHKGDFRSQLDRTQRWLRQAEAARDMFHTSMLRVAHAIVWVAHDQPERARSELDRAEADSGGAGGVLDVVGMLYRDIIERYEGRDIMAWNSTAARVAVLASPAAQTPFLGGYAALHAAWSLVRTVSAGRGTGSEEAVARETIAGMRGLGLDIWTGVADALESNLDYLAGHRDAALHRLDEAEQTFRRLHMLCLAACARKRRGQYQRAELGARLQDEANAELRSLGVVDVERWSRAYWSIFDVEAVELSTHISDAAAGDHDPSGEVGAPDSIFAAAPPRLSDRRRTR